MSQPLDTSSRFPVRAGMGAMLALLLCATVAGAAPTQTSTPRPARHPWLTRRDAVFTLGAIASVAVAGITDRPAREEALETHGATSNRLASGVQNLGNPASVGPVIALLYLSGGRLLHRPGLSAASLRVGEALLATGAMTGVLKETVGRVRPYQSGGDAMEFRPFSRNSSFPSGHTSIAFATATAIDRETSARWIPWVAYPAAAAVGWARIHEDRHWMSDVVAGAAIGFGVTHKLYGMRAPDDAGGFHLRPLLMPGAGAMRVGAQLRF